MTVPPGVMVPQSSDVTLVVQAASEYTLIPGEVATVPDELRFVVTVIAPKVASISVAPTNTNAISVTLGRFLFAILYSLQNNVLY